MNAVPSPPLADWAVTDACSRGRRFAESAGGLTGFALDRQRILQCAAFRRLQYKTQVFVTDGGDHFRTRLTHTLEVAMQARRLAAALRLNADLAETIALAHDLGHPPFGHAGEKALAQRMAPHGGFEHNHQSLRVVDYLEHPYPDFRGLNLSFEVREGLVKHHTRYDRPAFVAATDADDPHGRGPQATLEAQLASLADEMTYTVHDLEDGLMNGLIEPPQLAGSQLWVEAAAPWQARYPDSHIGVLRRAALDGLLDRLMADAVATSQARIDAAAPPDVDAVRQHHEPLACFADATRAALDDLQSLLKKTLYTHERVRHMDADAAAAIAALFDAYAAEPARMPPRFAARVAELGAPRVACDYIAGMTDRFCRAEYERARVV